MGNGTSRQQFHGTAFDYLCCDQTMPSPLPGDTEETSCLVQIARHPNKNSQDCDDSHTSSGCRLPLERPLGRCQVTQQPAGPTPCQPLRSSGGASSSFLTSRCGGSSGLHEPLAGLLSAPRSEDHSDCLHHAEERQPRLLSTDQLSDSSHGSHRLLKGHGQGNCSTRSHRLITPRCIGDSEPPLSQQWSSGSCCVRDGWQDRQECVIKEDLTNRLVCQGISRAALVGVFEVRQSRRTAADSLGDIFVDELLREGPQALCDQPLAALKRCVLRLQDILVGGWAPASGPAAGNSMCVALLIDDVLHEAHVGTSRAILARGQQALFLETSRPLVPGSRRPPSWSGSEGGGGNDLTAIHDPHPAAYTPADVPEINMSSTQLKDKDDFVVLATQGVWDRVGRCAAATVARSCLGASNASAASRAVAVRAKELGVESRVAVVTLVLHGNKVDVFKTRGTWMQRVEEEDAGAPQFVKAPQLQTTSMLLNVL